MSGNRSTRGSDGRLRELILYALYARGRKYTNAVWLLNFLFLADREAYVRLGHSLTGKTWRKMPIGPVPRRWGHVTARMIRDGELRLVPLPLRDERGRFAAGPGKEIAP